MKSTPEFFHQFTAAGPGSAPAVSAFAAPPPRHGLTRSVALWVRPTGLLLILLSLTAQAARPADNDGDGYRANRDCNDNDPTVWVLNSCGECAVEPPEGCSGTGCNDGDGDGYAVEGGASWAPTTSPASRTWNRSGGVFPGPSPKRCPVLGSW